MKHLKVVEIDESGKWDDIVRTFENFDVHYLSGYARAWHLHGEGDPLLLYYDDGGTRAINVVMKRDIAEVPSFGGRLEKGLWFDLSTPYGYGGFWVEGDGRANACTNHRAT